MITQSGAQYYVILMQPNFHSNKNIQLCYTELCRKGFGIVIWLKVSMLKCDRAKCEQQLCSLIYKGNRVATRGLANGQNSSFPISIRMSPLQEEFPIRTNQRSNILLASSQRQPLNATSPRLGLRIFASGNIEHRTLVIRTSGALRTASTLGESPDAVIQREAI